MTQTLIDSKYKEENLVDKLPQLTASTGYRKMTLVYETKTRKVTNKKKRKGDINKYQRYLKNRSVIFQDYAVYNKQYKEPDEYIKIAAQKAISENEQKTQEPTLYDKFMESGLIGCCSVEEDLSTTYKQVLSDSLESKYDQRIVNIQEKLKNYPDWDREEQIKRNQKALKKLKERHQKTLQIDDKEACHREEEFERFKQLMDQFRPQGSKLYSED